MAENNSSHSFTYGSIEPPTSNITITFTELSLSGTILISR